MHKSTQNHKNTSFFVWSFGEFAVGPICTPVAAFSQSTATNRWPGGTHGDHAVTRAGMTSVHPLICYVVVVVCISVLVHCAFSKRGTSTDEVLRVKRFAVWFVLEGIETYWKVFWTVHDLSSGTWLWYAVATFILVTFLVVVRVCIFAMFEVIHALQRLRLMSKSDATSLPSSSSEAWKGNVKLFQWMLWSRGFSLPPKSNFATFSATCSLPSLLPLPCCLAFVEFRVAMSLKAFSGSKCYWVIIYSTVIYKPDLL